MAETIQPGAALGDAALAAAAAAQATAPAEGMAAYVAPAPLSVKALIEAGAHFGHQTHRWNPKMKNFIFGERNGIHIVDLDQTLERFRGAIDFLRTVTTSGGKVLFVGTKRQAATPVRMEAVRSNQLFVNNRWLGGTLTNFRTVKKSLDRFKELLATMENAEEWNALSKKERSGIQRDVDRYRKSLDGLREMTKLPSAIFMIDVKREHIAVAEGRRLGIPIVAVVDTNCDPGGIDFVIPGNDDATRAIGLYCGWVAEACVDGAQLHEARVRSEASEESGVRRGGDGEAHAGGMGRVVVEIKQPPRRGRGARRGPPGSGPGGTRSAGVEHDPEEAAPSAPVEAAPAPAPAPAPTE